MPVKDGREYRSIQITNFSTSDEEESYIVEGYATTFDDPYEIYDGMFESIDRNALDGADMTDVIFQYDHPGAVLARQRNNTLSVVPDEHGLHVRADLKGSRAGRELHEAIKNGLVDRMSWGFTVAEDGWSYDRDTRTSHITRISKVFDVSAVSIPANDGTEIKARSYFDGVIEAEAQELRKCEQQTDERDRLSLVARIL